MNSRIELTESVMLVRKLVERTQERKIAWKETKAVEAQETSRFSTQLDPSQEAIISCPEDGAFDFSLIEHDPRWSFPRAAILADETWISTKTVLHVSVEKDPPYGYDSQEEADLSILLVNLYELARRSAYQIDASVGKAISYLDRIAG
ncbi:MAG TPA: hypothetical protein VE291_11320 [Terracidiphilus sp.]|jgi:hypothetical protein|nr:hypothetical protein [Terracidiphilus sp.]